MTGSPLRFQQANRDNIQTDFLLTEVGIGLTFSRIALDSPHQGKRDRNCRYARRAYDSVLYFLPKMISAEDSDEIRRQLAQLKSYLQQLGEEL